MPESTHFCSWIAHWLFFAFFRPFRKHFSIQINRLNHSELPRAREMLLFLLVHSVIRSFGYSVLWAFSNFLCNDWWVVESLSLMMLMWRPVWVCVSMWQVSFAMPLFVTVLLSMVTCKRNAKTDSIRSTRRRDQMMRLRRISYRL